MKIVSWNVNGLVACKRKGFLKVLANSKADIFCCQEIKTRCPLSTPGYLQFWNTSDRPGYSGTLTLARKEPRSVRYDTDVDGLVAEGRLIALEYESYYVINIYVPNSQSGSERLDFRTAWDTALLDFLTTLDKPVILCGDFNVARGYIDVYPENLHNEENPPGFTAEEREDMEQLLGAGYVDVFRTLYPNKESSYTWWSMRKNKRLENRGWRLDYFVISEVLIGNVKDVVHHTDILGSDHCPISLTFKPATTRKEVSAEDLAAMWRGIDWDKMEDQMLALQQKISRFAYTGRWEDVTHLQKKLVRSLAAKTLAVRHVVKNDSEAGIDGVKWKTEEEMMRAALSLTSKGYRAKPYRRIIITENGKNRTIDVPAAYDKAMQALYSYSLDPVAEATADRKSFAARKGRSNFDAHAYLCMALEGDNAPEWICKGDIQACFSTINQKWILKNIPMDKKVLREFLRAGAVYNGTVSPTNQGISQGASLSHTISNMTLDGLQSYIYTHLQPKGRNDYQNGELFRFVDDLIVTARTVEQAREIIGIIGDFLTERGLKLHPDKTYISNIDIGFEFLGRHYQRKEGILTVTPAESSIQRCEHNLEKLILNFKGSQKTLITKINRKLTGFATYHRITDATDAFRRIDSVVQSLLAKKMRMLHPRRKWKRLVNTYWRVDGKGRHIFTLTTNAAIKVMRLTQVGLTDHKPCRVNFNPYLDREYYAWLQHRRDIQKVSGDKYRAVWNRQSGKCAYCGQPMLSDQELDVVEQVLGKGWGVHNLAYIHRRCAFDVVDTEDAIPENGMDVITLLDGVTELTTGLESPYWELNEYFRMCEKSPLSLTFKQIEAIIGDTLPWEAYFCEAFWFDEAPGMGELWEDEYPFHAVRPTELEYCISDAWRTQGYRIQRLHLLERRVVFRKEVHNMSGLVVPPALINQKLPDDAAYEAKQFFTYLIKKYGL